MQLSKPRLWKKERGVWGGGIAADRLLVGKKEKFADVWDLILDGRKFLLKEWSVGVRALKGR